MIRQVCSNLAHAHYAKAHQYKNECNYYSLWTPTQKTFALNEQWCPNKKEENTTNIQKRERKLIF